MRGLRTALAAIAMSVPTAAMAQTPRPPTTPQAAVDQFMQAVADSNLTRMAELWGTSHGPAAITEPKNYQKQIVIIQAFLRGVQSRALGDVPAGKDDMRTVTTRLAHNGCSVTLPVNVVQWKGGWLVHDFDLVQAGQINQPCQHARPAGNPGG